MSSPVRNDEPVDSLLGVSIDTTSICNLRCTTCALDDSYPNPGIMSLATFRRLDDALPRLKHVAFSSSAEPLLNPNLVSMVRHAKKASRGRITTSFTTNATLLTEKTTRDLYRAGLDALEVSLDAATKETFERIRVRANFDLILANLKRAIAIKRPGRTLRWIRRRFVKYLGIELPGRGHPLHKPHLSVRFTVFEDNANELTEFVRMMRDIGIDHVVVNGLEPYTEEMSRKILFGTTERPDVVAMFDRLESLSRELGMRLDLPRLVPDTIDDCDLIDHSCILLYDGSVVPCSPLAYSRPYYWFGERHQHQAVTFGNVNDRPLFEIWSSPEYTQWRSDVRSGKLFDYCKTCLKRAAVICPLRHWKWLKSPK